MCRFHSSVSPGERQPLTRPPPQVMSALASSVPQEWWGLWRLTSTSTSLRMTMTPSQSSTQRQARGSTPSWCSLPTRSGFWGCPTSQRVHPSLCGVPPAHRGQVGLELQPHGAPMSLCPGLGPQEIPSSPFRIKVDPSHDATKVKAEGPGLSRTGEGLVGAWGAGDGCCGADVVGAMGAAVTDTRGQGWRWGLLGAVGPAVT